MSEKEIIALFDMWNRALRSGDPRKVVALYETDAILLPTLSNKVRHNHEEIEEYFVHLLTKGPDGKIDEANVRTYGEIAINSGIYSFTFKDGDALKARFSMSVGLKYALPRASIL